MLNDAVYNPNLILPSLHREATVDLTVGQFFVLFFKKSYTEEKQEKYKLFLKFYIEKVIKPIMNDTIIYDNSMVPYTEHRLNHLNDEIQGEKNKTYTCFDIYFWIKKDLIDATNFFLTSRYRADWQEKNGELGYVNLGLPIEWLDYSNTNLVELFQVACDLLEPSFGYGGIGLHQNLYRNTSIEYYSFIYQLAKYQPFLEIYSDMDESLWINKEDKEPFDGYTNSSSGIKGCNVLTYLSNEWLNKLGGKSIFKEKLGKEDFLYFDYNHGLGVRALLDDYPYFEKKSETIRELLNKAVEQYKNHQSIDAPLFPKTIPNNIKLLSNLLKPIRTKHPIINPYLPMNNDTELFPKDSYFTSDNYMRWLTRFD